MDRMKLQRNPKVKCLNATTYDAFGKHSSIVRGILCVTMNGTDDKSKKLTVSKLASCLYLIRWAFDHSRREALLALYPCNTDWETILGIRGG